MQTHSKPSFSCTLLFMAVVVLAAGCRNSGSRMVVEVYPDSMLANVSHHPVGINLDYFTDDDDYLKPARGIADALKAMGMKYLRYPGGNKSDFYFFSVPPYDRSLPTLARTGKGAVGGRSRMLQDYSEFAVDVLDFDEFMSVCRETGGEPVITVAADEYLVDYPEGCTWATREELIEHAAAWVRYANIKKGYGIRYWMIGNECWHENNANSTAGIYARDVVDFSVAMKAVDPSICIIPNGNSVEFCRTVLETARDHIDYFCISNYPVWQYKAGYATYRDTLQDLMHPVNRALKALRNTGLEDKIRLIVSEYGPFDWAHYWAMTNDMGHALCTFEMTGKQLQQPQIEFSQFWNTRWINNDSIENSVFDALDKNGNFNANGYALMIWGNFLGEQMVKSTTSLHVRTFASYSPDEGRLYVYLMNMLEKPQSVLLVMRDYEVESVLQAMELAGNSPDDVDPVWRECGMPADPLEVTVSGTSITVLEYRIRKKDNS
jgi:alpha-N-arabinofuranosidase